MIEMSKKSDHELVDELQGASIGWRIAYADPLYPNRDKVLAEVTKEIEDLKAEIIRRLGAVPFESNDNSARRLTQEDAALFLGSRTSLDDIKKAGYRQYGSSSGQWWFKHKDRSNNFLPHWILELENEARQGGERSTQKLIRFALGLEDGEGNKLT